MTKAMTAVIKPIRQRRTSKTSLTHAVVTADVEASLVGQVETAPLLPKAAKLFGSTVAPVPPENINPGQQGRPKGKGGRRKLSNLSRRQEDILNFIKKFIYDNNLPPTVREIQDALDITSTSVVDYNLKEIEKKGYITRRGKGSERSIARGIQLTEQGWAYETAFKANKPVSIAPRLQPVAEAANGLVRLALLGDIAAGPEIKIEEPDPESTFEVPSFMLGNNTSGVYALKVRGQSMIDAFIDDGDIVLIKSQETAERGETVVAQVEIDGELTTTLKKWYPTGKNRVELRPANKDYEPLVRDLSKVQIKGKLVGVIRTMA